MVEGLLGIAFASASASIPTSAHSYPPSVSTLRINQSAGKRLCAVVRARQVRKGIRGTQWLWSGCDRRRQVKLLEVLQVQLLVQVACEDEARVIGYVAVIADSPLDWNV
jgi:hypothetical protein